VGGERVAEDLGGYVGVGGATRVREHAGVVGLRGRLGIEPEAVGESGRDQGALQPVLEREPHAEVGGQAQRRDHLGGANLLGPLGRLVCHVPTRALWDGLHPCPQVIVSAPLVLSECERFLAGPETRAKDDQRERAAVGDRRVTTALRTRVICLAKSTGARSAALV
jgi:hypothetical protein